MHSHTYGSNFMAYISEGRLANDTQSDGNVFTSKIEMTICKSELT